MSFFRYGVFDEFLIAAGYTLEEGDLVLKTAYPVDAHRCARSDFAQGSRTSNIELFFYSPNFKAGLLDAAPSIAPVSGVLPLSVGICTPAKSLSKGLGEDDQSYAWCPHDGYIYFNGAQHTHIGGGVFGDRIVLLVDPIEGKFTVVKNDVPLGTVDIGTGESWHFAATISGNPGDLAVVVNAGQTRFWHPYQDLTGWWEITETVAPVNLATEHYMAAATDERRHEKFAGHLDAGAQDMDIFESVRFPMWGESAPQELGGGATVQMRINDAKKLYGRLTDSGAVNVDVPIWRVLSNEAFADAELIFTGALSVCDPDSRQTMQVVLRDQASRLDLEFRRALYPPSADAAFAGKSRSSLMGIGRNFPGDLIDAENGIYGLSDGPITAFGRNRAAGKPIYLGIDIDPLDDLSGVKSERPLTGNVTFEATSYGGAFVSNGVDYLEGLGDFASATVGTGGRPAGWDAGHAGVIGTPDPDFQLVGHVVVMSNDAAAIKWFAPHTPKTIKKGRTYAYKLTVTQVPYVGTVVDSEGVAYESTPARMAFGWTQGEAIQFFNFKTFRVPEAGDFTGTFTNRTGVDLPFAGALLCNEVVQGTGGVFGYLKISELTIDELPPIPDQVDLGGPGFAQMVEMITVDHGELIQEELNAADMAAIDEATGYVHGIYIASSESQTAATVLQPLLDTCGVARYNAPDGQFRFLRWYKPEEVPDDELEWSLTANDFIGGLLPYKDLAEKLTTRMVGRRNVVSLGLSEYGPDVTTDDVSLAQRELLARDYQWTVTAGVLLPEQYRNAISRKPMVSTLDRRADGDHAIEFLNSFYGDLRNFYSGTAWEPPGRSYRLGSPGRVKYDLPTLANGQKLMIVGRGRSPRTRKCKLIFWGL